MYRVYTASSFVKELKEILKNVNYGFEILINEDDILSVSKSIIQSLDKDVYSKIIISSETSKKSIRVYNLINRLVECGAEVYWNNDPKLYKLNSHFILVDKTNLINKIFYNSSDDYEKQVHYFSKIFNKILNKSEKIKFKDDKIKINFSSDKTIINRNEQIKLSWNITNADYFKISPIEVDYDNKNSIILQLQNDTLFEILATNKNEVLKKLIFVKVIQSEDLTLDVKVFDKSLKEFIYLTPKIESKKEKFYCYANQELVLFCKSDPKIRLSERKLGNLKSEFKHSFITKKNTSFEFKYFLNGTKFIRKIYIIVVKDSNIQDKPISLVKANLKRNKLMQFFIDFFKIS